MQGMLNCKEVTDTNSVVYEHKFDKNDGIC